MALPASLQAHETEGSQSLRPLSFWPRALPCCGSTTTSPSQDWELTETFHRASGPGGQNVNKVSTAVALRFEAARSPSLPEDAKARLRRLAGWRWTSEGALIVTAERHRSQALNREEAREKLRALILAALERPRPRRPTRPTAGLGPAAAGGQGAPVGAEGGARAGRAGGLTGRVRVGCSSLRRFVWLESDCCDS